MDHWDGVTVHHFQALCTPNCNKISDWDHQRLQFSRVKEGQSRHKIAPWANKPPNCSFWSNSFMKTMISMSDSSFPQLKYLVIYLCYLCAITLNTDLGLFSHFLLTYTNCTFLLLYCVKWTNSGKVLWQKRQDFIGCQIRSFNVVIGTLSLNNSFCILKKRLLFCLAIASHHITL